MPAADLVARSTGVTSTHGRGLRILAPEDELVYLAVHATAHGFTRLMWLYDLKLLCRASEIDWRVVVERARGVRMLTAVAFACDDAARAAERGGSDLPELRPQGLRHRLARRVQQRVERHEGHAGTRSRGRPGVDLVVVRSTARCRAHLGSPRVAYAEASCAASLAAIGSRATGPDKRCRDKFRVPSGSRERWRTADLPHLDLLLCLCFPLAAEADPERQRDQPDVEPEALSVE